MASTDAVLAVLPVRLRLLRGLFGQGWLCLARPCVLAAEQRKRTVLVSGRRDVVAAAVGAPDDWAGAPTRGVARCAEPDADAAEPPLDGGTASGVVGVAVPSAVSVVPPGETGTCGGSTPAGGGGGGGGGDPSE